MWTGNVVTMTAFQKSVLFNQDVLDVNQDVCPGSAQGDVLQTGQNGFGHFGGLQTWSKKMCDGSHVVILWNDYGEPAAANLTMTVNLDLVFGYEAACAHDVKVLDLWTKKQEVVTPTALGFPGAVSELVLAHGVAMKRMWLVPRERNSSH